MPKTDKLENEFLDLIFINNVAVGSFWEDLGSGVTAPVTADELYVSAHSAVTGLEGGDQTTNEIAYTTYARAAVNRVSGAGGWTLSANQVSNTDTVSFGQLTAGGPVTIQFFGIGTEPTGSGNLLYWGPLALSDSAPFTADSSTDKLTAVGFTVTAGDQVAMIAVIGATLPTGTPSIVEGTYAFVHTVVGDTFQLEDTLGGTNWNITASGAGRVAKVLPKTVTDNDTPQFAGGNLIIKED